MFSDYFGDMFIYLILNTNDTANKLFINKKRRYHIIIVFLCKNGIRIYSS